MVVGLFVMVLVFFISLVGDVESVFDDLEKIVDIVGRMFE